MNIEKLISALMAVRGERPSDDNPRLVLLIQTRKTIGEGEEGDPIRGLLELHTLDGERLWQDEIVGRNKGHDNRRNRKGICWEVG